jgi:DNA-binding SARP family transcriptional activator
LSADDAASGCAPGSARLRLRLLGPFRLTVDGRGAPSLSPKARAMLGALALSPGGRMARAAMARLLWPAASEQNARVALRQCLRGLREALAQTGFDGFEATRDTLALDLRRTGFDAGDVLAAAAAGVAHPALLGGADPFAALMQDAEGLGPAFEAWRAAAAEALRVQTRRDLSRALDAADGPADRLELARAIWAVDPLGEGAARSLMAALAARGERAAALDVYDTLWRRLDEALDAEPSEETQALLERLKRGDEPAAPARPDRTPAPREGLRIAMPPPVAGGDRPGSRTVAALLRAEIAGRLGSFDGLVVLLTDGGFAEAEAELQLALMADGEGWRATAMLVASDGGQVRATARARLAGDTWETELEAASLRLAAGVVSGLRGLAGTAAGAPATSPARGAIEGLAEALAPLLAERSRPAPTGRALFARAVEEGRPADAAEAALAAAAAAAEVEADPLSPDARRDTAWAAHLRGAFAEAAEGFALAAAMNPADLEGLGDAALGLALCGRAAEARAVARAADALRPAAGDADWRLEMTGLALGDPPRDAPPHPAEPLLLTAWRTAALARAGDRAAPSMAARLRAGEPDEALADRIAAALPHAAPDWRETLKTALRAALAAGRG